ncbi:CoA transferase [Pigmentiphaga soli]|uniref:CoA transferase n=1 Tax=Pigmentiphaga soli TaxID=1007095 RepID=A0ABP8GLD8_9BURK
MQEAAPLAGLTVVELGTSVAAPYAGLIFADLGARVVKVENPDGGDHARSWGPPFHRGTASTFMALNRGKESVALDLASRSGQAALRRLILDHADVVVQNLRPGLLEKFGFDAAALLRDKPALIWCDIGAFGRGGPLGGRPGYDPLVQATAGIMSVTGEPGRPPARAGVSIVDMGSGMWAVIGVLARLLARRDGNGGGRVATSLFETGLAWMTVPLANFEASGQVPGPQGSGQPQIVPYQAFRTKDAWLMVAAGNDGLFTRLCRAIGMPELAADPDYAANPARVANRGRLIALLEEKFLQFDSAALAARLDQAGVPNAPLLTVDRVARHPQLEAVGMCAPCEGDDLPLAGIPLSFDGTRPRAAGRPPALGEHGTAR